MMNLCPRIALLLLCLLIAACGDQAESSTESQTKPSRQERRGDDVQVTASVNAASVDIGARVTYRVEVRFREDTEVDWPPILDQLDTQVVYDTGIWKEGERLGSFRTRHLETILDPGIDPILSIAPTVIRWRAKDEERWHEARTETITVEVTSVAEGAPDFAEPLDYFDLPDPPPAAAGPVERYLGWILGGAALLLGTLFFLLFRKHQERAVVPPTPEEVALAELDRLESLGLLQPERVRELYYRLAAILRRYVEGRFGLEAPEQTTEEFLATIRRGDALPAGRREALEGFMKVADLVRYARHEPPTAEVQAAVAMLRDFVESSRPRLTAGSAPETKEVAGAL